MRPLYIILSFLIGHQVDAQKVKTLYTNESQVVGLFFPSPIRQAIVGAENFTFSYNKENYQNVGLLQGVRGEDSNILVITNAGDIFSYVLQYRKQLDTLNHFLKLEERMGRETPIIELDINRALVNMNISPKSDSSEADYDYREEYFKKFSDYQLKHNHNRLKIKRKGGLILKLKDLVYDGTEVYAVMMIKNRSGIDFETDYLEIFKINGNNRKKSSFQKVLIEPILTHKFPSIIKDGKKVSFVVVLPKFTLGAVEKIMLQLKEFRGNRMLQMVHK